VPGIGWLVSNYNHSRYETQPLEEALVEAFSGDQYLFGGQREVPNASSAKVAVTSTSTAGTAVVFANYNRLSSEKLTYQFYRPEKQSGELKTWEAARATSAAPTYFRPFPHEASKQLFYDGGVYHNNPIHIAERERKLIWPELVDQEPDLVLSIGTLFCPKTKVRHTAKWAPPPKGILANLKFLATMAYDHLHTSLDSQRTWNEFASLAGLDQRRYVRLNPELDVQPPKLDEVDKMQFLEEETRRLIGGDQSLKRLARQLLATSFYFEDGDPKEDAAGNHFEVEGQYIPASVASLRSCANLSRLGFFRCRLTERSEVEGLGRLIKRFANAGHPPFFHIAGAENGSIPAKKITIDDRVLDRMIRSRDTSSLFRMPKVTIGATSRATKTAISLCLTRGTYFPISGFPRCLHAAQSDTPRLSGRAGFKAVDSIRWASRTRSLRLRRVDWTPPELPSLREKQDIIARYSDAGHLLGSATSLASLTDAPSAHASMSPDEPAPVAELQGTSSLSANTEPAHELPAIEKIRHELPVIEVVHELPTTEIRCKKTPTFWIAKEDWPQAWGRGPKSMYLDLTRDDVLKVLEMPANKESDKDGDMCRVVRRSDGREGLAPLRCLMSLEDVVPSSSTADASPVGGSCR